MRLSPVPILTILTFLSFVVAMQSHPRVVLVDDPLLLILSQSASLDAASSSSITSTTSTSSTTSTVSTTTSSTTTAEQPPTFTSTDISTSTRSSSSRQSSTSFTQSTTSDFSSTRSFITETSTPPTSVSESVNPDSTSYTVTAVVSSPTDTTASNGPTTTPQGFFANKGAVAGTFLVVGLLGTAFLLCSTLWVARKFRQYRSKSPQYLDEYREFSRDRPATTPEPTLPATNDPTLDASNPTPNMIERLHATNVPPHNAFYDPTQGGYQRESADFDPYKAYPHEHPEDYHRQQDSGPYAYEPPTSPHAIPPALVAGSSYAQSQPVDSLDGQDPSSLGPHAL